MNPRHHPTARRPLRTPVQLVVMALLALLLLQPASGQAQAYDVCPSGCRYNSIQGAITAAAPGATVRIGPGTYHEDVTLRARVSLLGAGAEATVIDGSGSQPVITASDGAIDQATVVEGLSITGGNAPRGGGVYVRNGAGPTLRRVLVHGNRAGEWGGGVAVVASRLLLDQVTLRSNQANGGAALAVVNQSQVTLRTSTVEGHTSVGPRNSGAIYVFTQGHLAIEGSTIRANRSLNGGGLQVQTGSTVAITGGRFEGNSAVGIGGAIDVSGATLSVQGTTFAGNSAVFGGAVSVSQANASLSNCTFQNNQAETLAGALRVHAGSQAEVRGCQFTGNRAVAGSGGGIYADQNPVTVIGSNFDANQAVEGGAIFLFQSAGALVQDSSIVNNRAGGGAGIQVFGGRVRLAGNAIHHNVASAFGGGIVLSDAAYGEVDSNQIHHNTGGIDGGGVTFQDYATGLLSNNVLSFNQTTEAGGGVKIYDHANPTVRNNFLEGNRARDGAAIQIEKFSHPVVESNSFVGNLADHYGGGVVVNINADPILRFNVFTGNRAGLSGGAIVVNDNSRPLIDQNFIAGNSAQVAGGILVLNDNRSVITDNMISGNSAAQFGGGIHLVDSNAQVAGNQILDNQSGDKGGGVVILNLAPALFNNLISRNRAVDEGAGVFISNAQPTVRYNTIADNGRNENGDGIMLAPGAAPALLYNVISGNDYGIRSGSAQPAQSVRNALYDNRLGNYHGAVPPGPTDLLVDPQFVRGPLGPHYLAQTAAGQASTSPLVDAGGETAVALGLHQSTTRTDGAPDQGLADIGFHYEILPGKAFLPLVHATR